MYKDRLYIDGYPNILAGRRMTDAVV